MIPLHESSHGILSPTKISTQGWGWDTSITMILSPEKSDVSFEISNVTMICISYHPTLWLMIIYLYFMILHVGKDTTHLQYCATASWHWQMTNPPVTSLQKIMYTKCTFACKDLFVQIKNKVLKWTQPDIHGYPTPYGKWIHPGWYTLLGRVESFDESLAGATGMLIRWLQIHVQWAKPASHFINPVASVSCQWNYQKYPPKLRCQKESGLPNTIFQGTSSFSGSKCFMIWRCHPFWVMSSTADSPSQIPCFFHTSS